MTEQLPTRTIPPGAISWQGDIVGFILQPKSIYDDAWSHDTNLGFLQTYNVMFEHVDDLLDILLLSFAV
jgi:hypothetical protein